MDVSEWKDKRKRPRAVDIVGEKFGRLTVMRRNGYGKQGQTTWDCKCECGQWVPSISKQSLASGNTRSCGCIARELLRSRNYRHGRAKSRLYKIYHGICTRCTNPHATHFKDYGGRGIKNLWKSFEEFDKDMGKGFRRLDKGKYSISIERTDVNGNYCKENCRWANMQEQANNTRRNHYLIYLGRRQTLTQWARELGSTQERIRARLKNGFTIEQALTYKRHQYRP